VDAVNFEMTQPRPLAALDRASALAVEHGERRGGCLGPRERVLRSVYRCGFLGFPVLGAMSTAVVNRRY
jgi:hypothetical protein